MNSQPEQKNSRSISFGKLSSFRVIQILGLAVLVSVAVLFWPKFEWAPFWSQLTAAKPISIFWAVGAVVAFWFSRTLILYFVVRAERPVSYSDCLLTMILGMTTDQVVPGRVGYLVRWGLLTTRTGIGKTLVAVVLLACVLLEAAGLVSLLFAAFVWDQKALAGAGISWLSLAALAAAGLLFVGFLLSLPSLKNLLPEKLRNQTPWSSVFSFLRQSQHWKHWSSWLASSLLMWTVQTAVVLFSASAFGIDLSFTQAVLLLVAVNLAVVVPIVPANLGSIQIVCTSVLMSFGIEAAPALAFSVLYHAVHLLPLIFVGGLGSLALGLRPRKPAPQSSLVSDW